MELIKGKCKLRGRVFEIEKISENGGERKIEEREKKAKRRGERGVNSS